MTARDFDRMQNDGGEGYNPLRHSEAAVMEAHREEMARRRALADAQAAFEAEWTLEVTVARRAAWNEAIQSGEATTAGKVDPAKVAKLIDRLGYGIPEIRRAVAIHKL